MPRAHQRFQRQLGGPKAWRAIIAGACSFESEWITVRAESAEIRRVSAFRIQGP